MVHTKSLPGVEIRPARTGVVRPVMRTAMPARNLENCILDGWVDKRQQEDCGSLEDEWLELRARLL